MFQRLFSHFVFTTKTGLQICQIWRILRQNCSDDSTEVTEGVTSTPEIFGNKQGATSTPEIFGNKHSFVLTFFATNTIYVNCKCWKPWLNPTSAHALKHQWRNPCLGCFILLLVFNYCFCIASQFLEGPFDHHLFRLQNPKVTNFNSVNAFLKQNGWNLIFKCTWNIPQILLKIVFF